MRRQVFRWLRRLGRQGRRPGWQRRPGRHAGRVPGQRVFKCGSGCRPVFRPERRQGWRSRWRIAPGRRRVERPAIRESRRALGFGSRRVGNGGKPVGCSVADDTGCERGNRRVLGSGGNVGFGVGVQPSRREHDTGRRVGFWIASSPRLGRSARVFPEFVGRGGSVRRVSDPGHGLAFWRGCRRRGRRVAGGRNPDGRAAGGRIGAAAD